MKSRKPRIAFLPLLPSSNAATRTFCDRPVPYLRELGLEPRVFPPSSPRMFRAFVRPDSRWRVPLSALYWYGVVLPRRLVQIARCLAYDVVFVQRGLLRYSSPPLLEGVLWALAGKAFGRTILYHCDDALYSVARRSYYDLRFRLCDWVLTGNAEIAAAARRRNRNVFDLHGSIPVERYPIKRHCRRDVVVIGWIGHRPDEYLQEVVEPLVRVLGRRGTRLKVVSNTSALPQALKGLAEFERWTDEREFEVFEDFDIGVMPLADTPYNRGKEAFKIKEYMAAGLPVVCSPVGHNVAIVEDGRTGFFASTADEWERALLRLVEDHDLRQAFGVSARGAAEKNFRAAQHARRFGNFVLTVVHGREPETIAAGTEAAS